jgi:hypothetical protein
LAGDGEECVGSALCRLPDSHVETFEQYKDSDLPAGAKSLIKEHGESAMEDPLNVTVWCPRFSFSSAASD